MCKGFWKKITKFKPVLKVMTVVVIFRVDISWGILGLGTVLVYIVKYCTSSTEEIAPIDQQSIILT